MPHVSVEQRAPTYPGNSHSDAQTCNQGPGDEKVLGMLGPACLNPTSYFASVRGVFSLKGMTKNGLYWGMTDFLSCVVLFVVWFVTLV